MPLLAMFALSSMASGQGPTVAPGVTKQVTSSTTPKRDRFRPYTFTTTGKVVPPSHYCAPGTGTTSSGDCIPLFCPPGVTDDSYCIKVSKSVICSGKVTVRFRKGTTTISSRQVNLSKSCTYRSRVSFRRSSPAHLGVLSVRARFEGNVVLRARNSATHKVRAG